LTKIGIFDQCFYLFAKIGIFSQSFDFWRKFRFCVENFGLIPNLNENVVAAWHQVRNTKSFMWMSWPTFFVPKMDKNLWRLDELK